MIIPIAKVVFDQCELDIIHESLKNGWMLQGKHVNQFVYTFCELTEAKQLVATTSFNIALLIAIATLSLKLEDKVLAPAFTWINTVNCKEQSNLFQ